MAAKEMQFPWRWTSGTISLNLGVIWEMSGEMTFISRFIKSVLCILIALLSITSLARADETVLTIQAVDYPPYEIENPGSDGLLGFDVEVVVEAFKRVGMSAKVEFRPWKRSLRMAERGTAVAVLSCAKTEDRDLYLYYSDPISAVTNAYVASKDYSGEEPLTITDGKGLKVVVVGGYSLANDLDKANVAYHPAPDDKSALNILLRRNYDFFYSPREFTEYMAVKLSIADQLQYFEVHGQLNLHLCFSQKWPNSVALHEMFNKGLAEIRADGTYDAIHAKYQ